MALLANVLQQPMARCGELELLSTKEKRTLVITPGDTAQEYSRHSCLHEWVEEQALRNCDAIAVTADGHQLTYGELNDRADRLASYLRRRGLAPGDVVGVYLPKSTGVVTALLAVLKAGAAYVPVEIASPVDRIGYMLQDAKSRFVITQEALASIFPESVELICLDRDRVTIQQQKDDRPAAKCASEQPAYIIYTSGSTGRPKGVVIPHRAIVNYLSWCTQAYCMENGAGSIVTSTVAFDLTVTTLWAPLVTGRTAVLATGEPAIERVKEELLQAGPFVLKLTPAEMALAQHFLAPEMCADAVGAVVIGGEALYGEMLNWWRARAPGTRFINEYGPTETTVGCCVYEVPAGKIPEGAVPIGRPIANTAIYVVDEDLQPVPEGVVGEIYIAGHCVGHGYCNQAAATAEKFVPDPLGGIAGSRMYKSGDLARWGESGQIEYLGRNDSQVKIRGYRVELAEIEGALRKATCVAGSVVLVHGDSPASRHLAAFVVLRDRLQPQEQWLGEIRDHLQRVLPEYMIPSTFVSLERLPLTSNGKVDRQALSLQRVGRPEGAGGLPESDLELAIASIWKEVLSLDSVGVNEKFFEIGGHSLALFQVHWKLQSTLNPALTVVDLLANPTIQSLARHLSGSTLKTDRLLSLEERVSRKRALVQRRKKNAEAGGQGNGQLL
jgi:amino acid adenylation domain-containing protein